MFFDDVSLLLISCVLRHKRLLQLREGLNLDNCGSMKHVIDGAINMGLNYEPTPPFEPNCNPCELAIQHLVEKARVLLAQAKLTDYHLNIAMESASTPRVLVFRPIFPDTSSTSDETDQK